MLWTAPPLGTRVPWMWVMLGPTMDAQGAWYGKRREPRLEIQRMACIPPAPAITLDA